MSENKPLVITNFGGGLTRRNVGNIDSGLTKFATSWGYDPYSKPGNLTWMEQPTSILTSATGGTNNLVVAMKQHSTGSVLSVYAIDGAGRLQRVRVDNSGTHIADVDSPSIVGQLTVTPSFERETGIVFYGSTEKIFYGDGNTHIQKIDFQGSNPTSILGTNSVIGAVPRPMTTFQGKVYFGNGNNIGEIDSTELITTGAKLSPALPTGVVVRDLDVTPDGNYLQMTTSNNDTYESFVNIDTTLESTVDSNKFLWNGIDMGATAVEKYGGTFLTANNSFNGKNYTFGYDQMGGTIYSDQDKKVSLPRSLSPHPTAVFSSGDTEYFMVPERDQISGKFKGALYGYGQYDDETPFGLFRFLRVDAVSGGSYEVRAIPGCIPVANLLYLPDYFGYSDDIAGSGKIYFTTVENNADVSATGRIGRLWRHRIIPTGVGSVVAGVYETQTQLFSKKVEVKEIRFYTEPLVADNSFTIDLIGSGGSVMASGSKTFTVGTNITAGTDLVAFNPQTGPTYALGVRITNSSVTGTKNWTGLKLEIDTVPGGK